MEIIEILLVEDNYADARLVKEIVSDINTQLEDKIVFNHVTSLAKAKEFLATHDVLLILLDLGLEDSMGVDTLKKFKEFDREDVVIAYTGLNDINIGADLLKQGADDYLCKADVTESILAKTIWTNVQRAQLKKELKEKENLLVAQSKSAAMGDMINIIAHQWKQPLSVLSMIVNNIELDLSLGTFNPEKNSDFVKEIKMQIEHLATTIDDFRDFFRPNKDKVKINIQEPIENTLKIMDKSFENNKIKINTDFHSSSLITMYPNEFMQVLVNILKNAKEALVEKEIEEKEVWIKTYEENGSICVSIEDNAGGISSDILYSIFDPYFTTKHSYNGTGLGLYISKTIIDKHFHGKIYAENTKLGAKFTLKIPIE